LQLLPSYEKVGLRTKPKCDYTFIIYFNTLINKFAKKVEEAMWETHLPTTQKWDRHNIKAMNLAIFQNYQQQPCLFLILRAETKNSNEKNPQN